MTRSAIPIQFRAGGLRAIGTAGRSRPERQTSSTAALRKIHAGTRTALHHIDPEGADADAVDLLAEWHDALTALRAEVSDILHHRGVDDEATEGFVEGLRKVLGGRGMKAMLGDCTRMVERLEAITDCPADPAVAARLRRHRIEIAALMDRVRARMAG